MHKWTIVLVSMKGSYFFNCKHMNDQHVKLLFALLSENRTNFYERALVTAATLAYCSPLSKHGRNRVSENWPAQLRPIHPCYVTSTQPQTLPREAARLRSHTARSSANPSPVRVSALRHLWIVQGTRFGTCCWDKRVADVNLMGARINTGQQRCPVAC